MSPRKIPLMGICENVNLVFPIMVICNYMNVFLENFPVQYRIPNVITGSVLLLECLIIQDCTTQQKRVLTGLLEAVLPQMASKCQVIKHKLKQSCCAKILLCF